MMPLSSAFPAMPQNIPLAQAAIAPQTPPAQAGSAVDDPSMYRQDGSKKGQGFLGPLQFHDGRTSTELSIGVGLGGKQTEIPMLVPTLSKQEIDHLLKGGEATDAIVQKAVDHAMQRMKAGLPVFATDADKPAPMPQ